MGIFEIQLTCDVVVIFIERTARDENLNHTLNLALLRARSQKIIARRKSNAFRIYLCAHSIPSSVDMKKDGEYTGNIGRDWLIFGVSTVAMIGFLLLKPEWVWVVWPFQLTALAGALGRL